MATSKQTYECEVCGTELRYRGGPHLPRYCAEHRAVGYREARNVRSARYYRAMKGIEPPAYCTECSYRLLEPSPDGLCGFCQVEMAAA